jgi:hypothetical protein
MRISDLGQLLQNTQDPIDGSSSALSQAESLSKSPIIRSVLSEHDWGGGGWLEESGFDTMLIQLFLKFVNALVAEIVTPNGP